MHHKVYSTPSTDGGKAVRVGVVGLFCLFEVFMFFFVLCFLFFICFFVFSTFFISCVGRNYSAESCLNVLHYFWSFWCILI